MLFKKNEAVTIHFSMRDLGGQLPSATLSLANTDCDVRLDTGNFANATNTPDEDNAIYGHYALTLTAGETNADVITVLVQKSGYRDFELTLYASPDFIGADSDTLKTLSDQVDSVATTTELNKVPKSDGTASWNATALGAINAECDTAVAVIRGADSDTLETLSDQIDGIATSAGQPQID